MIPSLIESGEIYLVTGEPSHYDQGDILALRALKEAGFAIRESSERYSNKPITFVLKLARTDERFGE
ncbi:MAG: hypothetical protein WC761_03155 [Candidatus Paceibacterota bacterium]|jgi:hypothetical protein